MPCKYGKPVVDYSKYINKEILRCDQIRDLFMTKKDVDVGLLIVSFSFISFNIALGLYRCVHWRV